MTERDLNLILAGVVGSTAYGMNRPDSDQDMLGVFQAPTVEVLGLKNVEQSLTGTDPDWQAHELGKFMNLCRKCNPTVTELLWLEPELYAILTPQGQRLIDIRQSFLSTKPLFNAYGGYAREQFRRLKGEGNFEKGRKTPESISKHGRHLTRLILQASGALQTGHIQVRLNPQEVAYCFRMGELAAMAEYEAIDELLAGYEGLEATSVLPNEPDTNLIEDVLVELRLAELRG